MIRKNTKPKTKVKNETIEENLKLIDEGKPLKTPLAILSNEFKQKYKSRHHTDRERELMRKANKRFYLSKKSKKELRKLAKKICERWGYFEKKQKSLLERLEGINKILENGK